VRPQSHGWGCSRGAGGGRAHGLGKANKQASECWLGTDRIRQTMITVHEMWEVK